MVIKGVAKGGAVIKGRWLAVASITVVVLVSVPASASAGPGHGRAWELVTPAEAVSATIVDIRAVDTHGDRVIFRNIGPLPGAPNGMAGSHTLAMRGISGWGVMHLGSAEAKLDGDDRLTPPILGYSGDLMTSFWSTQFPQISGAPEGTRGLYRRTASGHFQVLSDTGSDRPGFVGASLDGERFVFSSKAHLVPADADRLDGSSLYEVAGSEIQLVDVDNGGSLVSACGSQGPSGTAVSRSTERIFFTNPAVSGPCGFTRVFLRDKQSETFEISASHCTRPDCNSTRDVGLGGISSSGSSAFLTTAQQLTNDDLDERVDLYRYDVSSEDLSLISDGSPTEEGVVRADGIRASDSGSVVYFYANGRLLPGLGSESGPNLYRATDSDLRFVAAVDAADPLLIDGSGAAALLVTASQLSASDLDGRSDAYLFNAASETFVRVSSGPEGGNGPFDVGIAPRAMEENEQPPNALSADGSRVFFVTAERLVSSDLNERSDIYEWVEGAVGLLSSGLAGIAAEYNGASEDGKSVFFTTTATLLPRDRDGGDRDIYTARLGGGFPEPSIDLPCAESCPVSPLTRVRRPALATALVSRPLRYGVRLRRVDSGAARSVVKTGRLNLMVYVKSAGRVTAQAIARLRGKALVIARGSAGATRRGSLRLTLRCLGLARRALARTGRLSMRLELQHGDQRSSRSVTLTLAKGA